MVKFNRARRSLPRALAARAEQADSHDPVLFSESGMGRDRATSLRRPRHSQTSWTRLVDDGKGNAGEPWLFPARVVFAGRSAREASYPSQAKAIPLHHSSIIAGLPDAPYTAWWTRFIRASCVMLYLGLPRPARTERWQPSSVESYLW